jgi:uncharacterized protein
MHTEIQQKIVSAAEQLIRQTLAGDSSGHDWWHIDRVRNVALRLAKEEGADLFVVELAALLHDIADWKFHAGDDTQGPQQARAWLTNQGVAAEVVEHVAEIIATLSFKGAGVPTPMRTKEGAVVQDADRLDAIGAIGVARAFAYGGHRGRPMHDPDCPPESHASFAAYKKNSGPTLNHFYEKLFLLKDRMNTAAAKRLALARHAYLEQFVEEFLAEWEGTR